MVNQNWSLDLSINGSKYLSQSIEGGQIDLGDVGLNCGRIKDISLLDFNTQNYTNPDSFTVSDTEAILLEGETLPAHNYIHLYDTAPYQIAKGHIAVKLPCDGDNNTLVNVYTGQSPNVAPIELEYFPNLSTPVNHACIMAISILLDPNQLRIF